MCAVAKALFGALFMSLMIWFSMWIGGPSECDTSPRLAVGSTMVVAGCK